MRKYRAQVGFTLIELLLVIAVLAIMTSIAIVTVRRDSETKRIDKAALEIGQVLQAATTYYVDHQVWPQATSDFSVCKAPQDKYSFQNVYLPNGNAQSVFGYPYCWGATTPSGPLFQVLMQVPPQTTPLATEILAKRIAARLPSGKAMQCDQSDTCFVRAEIPRPTGVAGGFASSGTVAALGYCQANDPNLNKNCQDEGYDNVGQHYRITFNACEDTDASIVAAPDFYDYTKTDSSSHSLAELSAKQIDNSCVIDKAHPNKESCDVLVQAKVCSASRCAHHSLKGWGSVGISYMVACMPKPLEKKIQKNIY